MAQINFKYFENPLKNAVFTEEECQSCGTDKYCLEGEYFDHGDDIVSVCINCLSQGKIKVSIPQYIRERIGNELGNDHEKELKIDELERTPPVPWIQFNDWPVCCGDFSKYVGEWKQDDFVKESDDGNGLTYLLQILEDSSKEKIVNPEAFWEDVGQYTAIFVFECIDCSKRIAVPQSY